LFTDTELDSCQFNTSKSPIYRTYAKCNDALVQLTPLKISCDVKMATGYLMSDVTSFYENTIGSTSISITHAQRNYSDNLVQ